MQIWNAKPQSSEFHHWKILPSLPVPYNQVWELQSKLLGWLIHWIFDNWSILGSANIRRKRQFLETMILRKRYCSFGLQFDNEELQKIVTRNLSFSLISPTFWLVGIQITKVFLYKGLCMDIGQYQHSRYNIQPLTEVTFFFFFMGNFCLSGSRSTNPGWLRIQVRHWKKHNVYCDFFL